MGYKNVPLHVRVNTMGTTNLPPEGMHALQTLQQ